MNKFIENHETLRKEDPELYALLMQIIRNEQNGND